MNQPPFEPADPRPAGNQFSLRGLFILMTVLSLILALMALAIRQPLHWLGAIVVFGFCLAVIAALEGIRKVFPPPPQRTYYRYVAVPAVPRALDTQVPNQFAGVNPFGSSVPGQNPFAPGEPARTQDEVRSGE